MGAAFTRSRFIAPPVHDGLAPSDRKVLYFLTDNATVGNDGKSRISVSYAALEQSLTLNKRTLHHSIRRLVEGGWIERTDPVKPVCNCCGQLLPEGFVQQGGPTINTYLVVKPY